MNQHPAKYSPEILDTIRGVLDDRQFTGGILDPFAGTGRVHDLQTSTRHTWGIELEPEWGGDSQRTSIGDCRKVMREWIDVGWGSVGMTVDAIATSPTYGNRFADRDMRESCAGTYMKGLGREASAGSSCHMQWGPKYRDFHHEVWGLAVSILDGPFILNIKDHYRDFKRQKVAGWHVRDLEGWGLAVVDIIPVPTTSLKYGSNADARCTELVIVMEKAA